MRKISGLQWWAWLQSLFRLSYYCYGIKRRPYVWLQKQQYRCLPINDSSTAVFSQKVTQHAESLHEAVRLAARTLPFKTDCLPRSLVLRDLLHKRGIDAKVLIGVAKNPESTANIGILSHAWVEVDGKPIGEREDLKDNFRVVDNEW